MLQLNQKNWNCPKKLNARQSTIINAYKDFTGLDKIPEDKQYWTLCGQCANEDGSLFSGSEFDQLVNHFDFLRADQFYGVEINKDIHDLNFQLSEGNFFQGDFKTVLNDYASKEYFNPAVINFDTINFPHKTIDDLARIIELINILDIKNVMIVYNVVLNAWYQKADISEVITHINEHDLCRCVYVEGEWDLLYDFGYVYKGTGRSKTTMGTICLVKGE